MEDLLRITEDPHLHVKTVVIFLIQEQQSSEDGLHLKCLAHLNFKLIKPTLVGAVFNCFSIKINREWDT